MGLTNFPNGLTSFGIPLFGGGGQNPYTAPGQVYFVGNPNDTNLNFLKARYGVTGYDDGTQMFHTTLQSAINSCADWRGDLIIVGPMTQVVTTPVLFNKKGISVVASFNITGQDNGERFTINADATAGIAAAIISEPCTIIGLGFDSANAAVAPYNGGTVQLGPGSGFDGGNYVRLAYCRFTNWGHAPVAIDSNYNDFLKIENCDFDGTINGTGGSANVFNAGLNITQGHYCTVQNCMFRGCTYAIVHGTPNPASSTHSNQNFLYMSNTVMVSDASAAEKFVDFNTLATYSLSFGLIADNYLGTATDTGSYNDTVANAKTAHVTFAGNHYEE